MAQDLRGLFAKERENEKFKLKQGHEERFMAKLDSVMPKRKKPVWTVWKIAASIIVLIGLGLFAYEQINKTESIETIVVDKANVDNESDAFSFGDLSPDLKKVENYYIANIGIELSKLQVSEDNKELVDSFMERLSELNKEYENLNKELYELGPNDQTIASLIENLQLRLQLLQKLKRKLNQLKSSKNEQITESSI
ncbi:hypothetical protein [Maribacter thermophilus]|uniref:hypothetical protein n=1 Tax=Maribacter thermophilus TaxID=1197874 RepID=UPI000640BC36|nr:hypothetical protein [Maribacter thermophilus]